MITIVKSIALRYLLSQALGVIAIEHKDGWERKCKKEIKDALGGWTEKIALAVFDGLWDAIWEEALDASKIITKPMSFSVTPDEKELFEVQTELEVKKLARLQSVKMQKMVG